MRVSRPLGVPTIIALGGGNPKPGYKGTLELWNSLLRHVVEPSGIQFLNQLSRAEYVSLSILRDWWYRYRKIAESFVYHRTVSSGLTSPHDAQLIAHFFDLEVHGVKYHHELAYLFIREFFPRQAEIHKLSVFRNRAVRAASTHNMATKFCLNSVLLFPRTSFSELFQSADVHPLSTSDHQFSITATLEACPWLSRGECSGRPHFLWDVARKRTIKTSELQEEPYISYICISHTWGRWIEVDKAGQQLEAFVDGVPWPIPRNSKFDVQSLPLLLQKANFSEKYVWFDLLCIPQCGHQQDIMDVEIARQAAIFASSRRTGAWLNDIEDWERTEHALRWLSALYFHQMSWGPEFRFGNTVADVISLPQTHSPIQNIDISLLKEKAEVSTNLSEVEMLPGWFTSLWTLQEFCLRPDMILYDKYWRPLKICGDDVIHLDELLAFMDCAMNEMFNAARFSGFHNDFVERKNFSTSKERYECEDKKRKEVQVIIEQVPDFKKIWPAGNLQLVAIAVHSQLINSHAGPSTILRFGDTRFCSSRRAEAIMSALGATEWYPEYKRQVTTASGQMVPEPNLIHGKYPAVFLNEVIKKTGADFFASGIYHRHHGPSEIQKMFTVKMAPIGSLLPFSAGEYGGEGFSTRTTAELADGIKDHPTVKGWTVQSDGTVMIREAGIMAVSRNASRSENIQYWTRIKLYAPLVFETGQCNHWMRSEEEFETIPKSLNLFMVCLGDNLKSSYGIILHKIEGKFMVKVGLWACHSESSPGQLLIHGKLCQYQPLRAAVPSTKVNWTVL